MTLEDELEVGAGASLVSKKIKAKLVANGGSGGVVEISNKTSMRQEAARCLLVGRQAATADIRIQHGSISRKHAILYYCRHHPGQAEAETEQEKEELVLRDLGGKHGTFVNGSRVMGETHLKQGDRIQFGNVRDNIFLVQIQPEKNDEDGDDNAATKTVDNSSNNNSNNMKTDNQNKEETPILTKQHHRTTDHQTEPKTRQDREAEIAAMIASFDQTPTYQKHVPDSTEITVDKEIDNKEISAVKSNPYNLPIADQFKVGSSEDGASNPKPISALVADKSGSRFAVGYGEYLRLYDFSGMDRQRTTPFKTVIVEEGYKIADICYSSTGDRLLVTSGSVQPKVFDRDGEETLQFVRGDMYVTDMSRTSGHTHAVTGVDWHPLQRDWVLTSSMDGSARIWNLNGKTHFHMLVCDRVYQPKSSKGYRTKVTSVSYHPGGREFVVGTICGTVQVWNATRVTPRPEKLVIDAHGAGKPITCVCYNAGGTLIASRSPDDDSVNIWQSRRLSRSSTPLASCADVPSVHETAKCDFSPDGKTLAVGCSSISRDSSGKRVETGALKFFAIPTTKTERLASTVSLDLPSGVVHTKWHPKLNQILVGCSDGTVLVYFDPSKSRNGAMISARKAVRKADGLTELLASRMPKGSAAYASGEILTPLYQEGGGSRRKRKNQEDDGPNSKRPEPPATGIKTGGQSSATVTFTQFVANSSIAQNKVIAGKDPREELFQYSDGKGFGLEGDERILAEKTVEAEEEELRKTTK